MEMYGNVRCVTFGELVESGLMSKPNYDKHVKEKRFRVVQKGGNGRKVLIDFESMPDKLKSAYKAEFPNAEEELKSGLMQNLLKQDTKAVVFYRDRYRLSDGSGLTDKKQAEYVLNAQVMNEMVRVEKETTAMHHKCGYSHSRLVWQIVMELCEKLRELYGHTLPRNERRLRDKFNAYKRDGYEVLVSGKNGNQSARKIKPEESRLLLKLKRSKFPAYTDSQLFAEYNKRAEAKGLQAIKSQNTMLNYLNSPEVIPLWFGAVHGMQQWKARYTAQISTKLPQMRDSLWYSDGTKLNLYYKDENGKMCTTSVYEVVDAFSETFLGYDIAPHEAFDSQYRAFRMAIEVAGCRPWEIVNDNQGGHSKLAAQGFFKRICHLHKPTMPYNGQSKTIENIFGRFQQQVLHKLWNFTGQNITAKKLTSKPNIEFIEKNAFALPTLAELKKIYKECRDEWNNMAHPATGVARIEMYKMSENPETEPVTAADMIQMFWIKSGKPVTYTNQGLSITIQQQTYDYEVYDEDGLRNEFWALRNIGRKFYVMYDPMDMTRVELWEETASGLKYSTDATPKVVISRATQERTSEEDAFMRQTIARNKATMGTVQITMEDFDLEEQIAAELFGFATPKPKNVSKKLMEKYRDDMEHERISAPISLPEKMEREEREEDMAVAYSSIGSYTKTMSNMDYTDDDLYDRF